MEEKDWERRVGEVVRVDWRVGKAVVKWVRLAWFMEVVGIDSDINSDMVQGI